MASNKIDVRMLSKMFLAGAQNLEAKKEWINELNVFPVPDGDSAASALLFPPFPSGKSTGTAGYP